ncbi:hypothetical protein [Pectinatus brassicae]|uniref:Ribosomal protein S27AE n=1 Tax=Pectinatus brassicae TaxID=862415 RepID=A0A840UJL4_9FIRM|nr:hypothetical protein [Pectinatus brassicae]MBB5337189.1 ribosomal protein S27AE [Pectinatus brassicae]
MYQENNRETSEILEELYKKGFKGNLCTGCTDSYILATKVNKNLKLTCRKCGTTKLLNIKKIFASKA